MGISEVADDTREWFWSEEWRAGEREAEADLAAGGMTEFENVEDPIRFLRKCCANKDQRRHGSHPGKD